MAIPWVDWAGLEYPGLTRDQLAAVRRDKREGYPWASAEQVDAAIRAVLRPGSLVGRQVRAVEREAMGRAGPIGEHWRG